jgi:hypothetical protein
MASTRVVLPWSTWAMMAMLRKVSLRCSEGIIVQESRFAAPRRVQGSRTPRTRRDPEDPSFQFPISNRFSAGRRIRSRPGLGKGIEGCFFEFEIRSTKFETRLKRQRTKITSRQIPSEQIPNNNQISIIKRLGFFCLEFVVSIFSNIDNVVKKPKTAIVIPI